MTISFNDPVAFALCMLYAVLSTVGGYYLLRFLSGLKPAQTGEDRMAKGLGFFVFLFLAAIASVVTFVMLFIGHAGIPALVVCGLVGAAFGMASRS